MKSILPRSAIKCVRCEKQFFLGAQLLLVRYDNDALPVHSSKRCYSAQEDILIQQAQIGVKTGSIMPVGPQET